MDFAYIEKVIEAVRKLLSNFPEYAETVSKNANIRLREENGSVVLHSISFRWYDEILVTGTKVSFYPERGNGKVVMAFESFDDLLRKAGLGWNQG